MYGKRLVVGAVVMIICVPLIVMFLLDSWSWKAWFVIAMTAFSGWGIGDLAARILTREPEGDLPASGMISSYTSGKETGIPHD